MPQIAIIRCYEKIDYEGYQDGWGASSITEWDTVTNEELKQLNEFIYQHYSETGIKYILIERAKLADVKQEMIQSVEHAKQLMEQRQQKQADEQRKKEEAKLKAKLKREERERKLLQSLQAKYSEQT